MLGAVKTLRRDDVSFDPDQREMLMDMIDREAERLSGIVGQILLTGQLDAGRLPLEHERFDPVALRGVSSTRPSFTCRAASSSACGPPMTCRPWPATRTSFAR